MSNLIFTLDVQKAWYISLFRSLFAFLDWVVYFIIELLFRAIFNIANFELYGLYEKIQERVFVVLGIFMLFKVTISLITYLVNPDKINDKEQGVSKVVTRIITVLVMLIALPTFFSLMTEAQNKLLPVIPRVIIGTANTLSSDDVTGISENMALTMIQGFAHKKDRCDGDTLQSVDDFLVYINDTCSENDNTYKYDYLPIISTITGVLMCYVLFSLCISVAIRAFKLIILRSIAPIPIVSYVDPKSSKDGAFSTWLKTFFSTWGELFIHIGIIYFIVYIIDFMLSGDAWKGFFNGLSGPMGVVDGIFMFAFLIIGLLFFAKQAPKFVMDTLGIKTKGNFVRMLGMGATALGMGGTMASSLKARKKYNADNQLDSTGNAFKDKTRNALRSAGAVGGSLFSGLASGAAAGGAILSSDKPGLMTGIDAQSKYNARNLSRISAGSTALGRMGSRMEMIFGGETEYDSMNKEKSGFEAANKNILQYKNTMEKKALEKDDLFVHFKVGNKTYGGNQGINYMEFMAHTEGAKNGNTNSLQWFIDHGFSRTEEVQEEYMEEYQVTSQIGTGIYGADGKEIIKDVIETKTRPATRTVTRTVADWQGAQSYIDKIKDVQTQMHAKRVVEAAKKYEETKGTANEDATVFVKYGTEYNDYRLAVDAAHDVNLSVDFTTYGIEGADASKGDTVGVKQALGETNKKITGIITNPKYKAAKINAEESKKSN